MRVCSDNIQELLFFRYTYYNVKYKLYGTINTSYLRHSYSHVLVFFKTSERIKFLKDRLKINIVSQTNCLQSRKKNGSFE